VDALKVYGSGTLALSEYAHSVRERFFPSESNGLGLHEKLAFTCMGSVYMLLGQTRWSLSRSPVRLEDPATLSSRNTSVGGRPTQFGRQHVIASQRQH